MVSSDVSSWDTFDFTATGTDEADSTSGSVPFIDDPPVSTCNRYNWWVEDFNHCCSIPVSPGAVIFSDSATDKSCILPNAGCVTES